MNPLGAMGQALSGRGTMWAPLSTDWSGGFDLHPDGNVFRKLWMNDDRDWGEIEEVRGEWWCSIESTHVVITSEEAAEVKLL